MEVKGGYCIIPGFYNDPPGANGGNGGIGGKGGYNKLSINVISGQQFSLFVGKGGNYGEIGYSTDANYYYQHPICGGNSGNGQQGQSGENSIFDDIIVPGGGGGGGGQGVFFNKCTSPPNITGSNIGTSGTDGTVLNYNGLKFQIRTYIPNGYLPISPSAQSKPGNSGENGENGLILIYY